MGPNTGTRRLVYSVHASYGGATTIKLNTYSHHYIKISAWETESKDIQQTLLKMDLMRSGIHTCGLSMDFIFTRWKTIFLPCTALKETTSQFPQSEEKGEDVLVKPAICSHSDMEGWTLDWLVMKLAEVYIHFSSAWSGNCLSAAVCWVLFV